MEEIKITSDTINLDQFLKWANIVMSGGEAKHLIQAGKVEVNGEIELKRGKTLKAGDIVSLTAEEKKYKVSRG
ncbi:MAG: ribosome-associated protein [Halanaerobium sp. 4-GBenrich]|jgi:ribosome-associated protein|uniref:Ribosome-associated protein n=1 Tax=Halanaerobium congolense TaxID=54121 RepID=A0A1G6IL05_9FIRM|nr:RNA-binding S4 domain-containing protein [Halanaerobium congolense]ODS50171.1 MAG: ribosome-associated protein [Halanaerobium sp. 4-GBenrich]PUU92346.1 MAG: ribosome-associated protein [Halanaerobium sp.]PTX15953.1 ribosome-associated protein [Halanaerobium congolense]TDP12275.1 ribosome-associated protein [Halanaerobium congolense]TDS33850.1 ribosome-associated protein [Halanaerobium congolense]